MSELAAARAELARFKDREQELLEELGRVHIAAREHVLSNMEPRKMEVLNCWHYGTDPDVLFEVELPGLDTTISRLREAIKNKNSVLFHDVDAHQLNLYAISVAHGENYYDKLKQWDLKGKTRLSSRTKLSQLFSDHEKAEWFIIVHAPTVAARTIAPVVTPNMTLYCWLWGDQTIDIFPVEISSTLGVGGLKRAIMKEKSAALHGVDVGSLVLYKVSLPCNEDLRRNLETLELSHDQAIESWEFLSDIFADVPPHKHLHIIIKTPSSTQWHSPPSLMSLPSLPQHLVAAQRHAFLAKAKPMAPSSIADPREFSKFQAIGGRTIYCNRPADAVAVIPPTLLHPVFGDFLDDCDMVEPTHEDNSLVMGLHSAMSNYYDLESDRAVKIRELFTRWGLAFVPSATRHGYTTDGDMREGEYRYAIAEIKNEMGSTRADPYNLASFYYLEFSREYAGEMTSSSLPCLVILLVGPFIMFAGAAWNDRPVVQPLSFVLPLHYHPTDTHMRVTVARHLKAFKNAIDKLRGYYQRLLLDNNPSNSHQSQLFPYPTSFRSLQNATEEFQYTSQYPNKLVFFGTLAGQPICIKFVRHYSMAAHRFSASLGCAPTLHGFNALRGGWYMVVMDLLDGYVPLCDVDVAPPPSVFTHIKTHLDRLHSAGYVHGDVRSANIMVLRSDMTKFMLIDFDWAGSSGKVMYPLNVNREIWRPADVVDGAPIEAKHDIDMLNCIIMSFKKGE
ncbi:hypothetical protein BKA82DRAFT_29217 [Pisolithus tinctorius]|uniref:Crinkler effector protein N-terminal domain-containing protein n=1 Tax=Pisolithus tinctorius Marx 270 TaxID=870435 RepID=A0A0C3IVD7_PISTI|nr:hypothetical protein BKA82DRAFT_29217 [Pisolithus tinctorius]KIO00813.1 hypothetical protein M404DRAFT_29217 [Pisolithus tinctorius Marx 270]